MDPGVTTDEIGPELRNIATRLALTAGFNEIEAETEYLNYLEEAREEMRLSRAIFNPTDETALTLDEHTSES